MSTGKPLSRAAAGDRWTEAFAWAGLAIALVAVWAGVLLGARTEMAGELEAAKVIGRNLAASLARQQAASVRVMDVLLRNLRDEWERDPRNFGVSIRRLDTILREHSALHVFVQDAEGMALFNSAPNAPRVTAADREYFRFHAMRPTDDLHISEPMVGRTSGLLTVRFTRPVQDRNGFFAGVIAIAVPPADLERAYKGLDLGRGGIALMRTDGVVLVRSGASQVADEMSRVLAAPASGRGEISGQFRSEGDSSALVSYHQLPGYPLILAVGQSVDDIHAANEGKRVGYVVFGAIATALLFTIALLLHVGLRNRRRIREREARDAEQLRYLAHHDALTSLPNRALFNQLLGDALARVRRGKRELAVLFMDVDNFKNVNDAFGHDAGDRLLRELAMRVRASLREADVLARLSGDEFVVIVEQLDDRPLAPGNVAQKLLDAMQTPFIIDDQPLRATLSIGISSFPSDGVDADELLRNADLAMYRVKDQGRNSFQFFTAAMTATTRERMSTESGLWDALQLKQFQLHYQPRVDTATGRVGGSEALLRWYRPGHGLACAGDFISIAEANGSIVPIGLWVLDAACAQNAAWVRAGLSGIRVAVNLSPLQFAQATLVKDLERALQQSGLPPHLLELEITESVIMKNPEQAIRTLQHIKAMGVALTIDDFGTGYSSLSYLKKFPIDRIKIDRSFVRDLPRDGSDAALTRTIISMAHSLGLAATAEGVETEAQFAFLRENGCDELQGYYFGRPVPADEFRHTVSTSTSVSVAP